MGLMQCPDCGKGVSELAEQCPNCGRPVSKLSETKETDNTEEKYPHVKNSLSTNTDSIQGLLLMGLVAAIGFGIWTFSATSEHKKFTVVREQLNQEKKSVDEHAEITGKITVTPIKWYEGGNLHQRTLNEWTQATRENRLATCADFAAAHPNIKNIIAKSASMEALLPYAIQLVSGIDEVAKEKAIGNQKVAETAAMLMIILK